VSSRLEDIIDLRAFNESVTVLGGLDTHITPLGIYYDNGVLKARIYPGTRLHRRHELYYEACISFPFTAEPYYYAVISRDRLKLRSSKTLHTPCPDYPSLTIEAVIARRERADSYIIVTFTPTDYYMWGLPKPYRRSLGCSVELLIALTRIAYWSSHRPANCPLIERLMRIVEDSLSCILHSTWAEDIHRLAVQAAELAYTHALAAGCTA
jgi:hypothetical protein